MKYLMLIVTILVTSGLNSQNTYVVPQTTIDFSNAALAFNSMLPLLFGVITYLVGQLSKTSQLVAKIPQTAWKVGSVALVVLICVGYFGFHVSVVYALIQAIIGVFVGGGIFSMVHVPLSQTFVKVPNTAPTDESAVILPSGLETIFPLKAESLVIVK